MAKEERSSLGYLRIATASAIRSAAWMLAAAAAMFVAVPQAEALPSFARQTGLACGACHTAFPQLTPLGRRFKLMGYTQSAPGTKPLGTAGWVPPVSAMTIFGFTHTAAPMDNAGSSLSRNDNVELQQASLFYGGAITEHVGAFVQATYAGPQFGPPAANQFMWDNLDVRYANTTNIAGVPVIYGISVNNNPTVQDVLEHHAGLGLSVRGLESCQHPRRQDPGRQRLRRPCARRHRLCVRQRHVLSGGRGIRDAPVGSSELARRGRAERPSNERRHSVFPGRIRADLGPEFL